MKKTRQGVFETNSSSTHSICVAQDLELKLPGSIHFEFGEFGWEHSTLDTISDRASYLYTGMYGNSKQAEFAELVKLIESKGVTVTMEEVGGSYWENGYVDHAGDLGDFIDTVIENEDTLMNFLFSDLSFIRTGNDNDESDVSINVSYPHSTFYKGN